jgi:hypothetical protein
MRGGLLWVVAAGGCAVLASWFMWWATKRSAIWAMGAGLLLVFAVLALIVAVAWAVTYAAYGS